MTDVASLAARPTLRFSAQPNAARITSDAHAVRLRDRDKRADHRILAVQRALTTPFELRPGDRWHRLLSGLASHGPMTEGDLYRATNPRKHPPKVERARVNRALAALRALQLVDHVDRWGWTITARGREALCSMGAENNTAVRA